MPPFPGFIQKRRDGENLLFPVPGVGQLSNAKASVDFYDPSRLCFHFFHILFSYCDYQLFS
ncbi:hypothetical protein EWT59_00020 [Escherichia coli O25b:H4]|uniref:Uncharacterized protein n=1 Tax=Escherichia coli O25b:H4 TaxID=941280 RepID=A0A7I0L240_ECO25|nr:hypothetical protein EWT59_00020 [Escherichia coli O25b:H4]